MLMPERPAPRIMMSWCSIGSESAIAMGIGECEPMLQWEEVEGCGPILWCWSARFVESAETCAENWGACALYRAPTPAGGVRGHVRAVNHTWLFIEDGRSLILTDSRFGVISEQYFPFCDAVVMF